VLDEHQHMQPLEQHGLHHQEVAGDDRMSQRSQDRPVCPRQPRRLDLTLKNGELMAQDQDLGVLAALRPGEQGKPAEYPKHREVGESYRHQNSRCRSAWPPRSQMPNLPSRAQEKTTGQRQ
jgi:hypothetical protein